MPPVELPAPFTWQSKDFVGARAIVDLVFEVLQFIGCVRIGRPRDYLTVGNFMDLARCVSPIILAFHQRNQVVRVVVLLLYWERLLEVHFSEKLTQELQPITRIAQGLMPATIVAFIAFCGLSHAFLTLNPSMPIWPDAVYNSFTMLITAGLPDDGVGSTKLIFSYLSVLIFSIFFLNIFIGVMGENYACQKARVWYITQEARASQCSAFLLRARVMPVNCLSRRQANVLLSLVVVIIMAVQVCIILGHLQRSIHLTFLFIFCQLVIMVCIAQDADAAWATVDRTTGKEDRPHYLWLALPWNAPQPSQLDLLEDKVSELQAAVQRLTEELQAGDQRQLPEAAPEEDSSKLTATSRTSTVPCRPSNGAPRKTSEQHLERVNHQRTKRARLTSKAGRITTLFARS